jgi:hypothetical protein
MRYVLENIEAGKLADEMKRRGIALRQRVRVVVETLNGGELDDLPLARMAETGGAFDFLADEPDLYSEADVRSPNV